MSAVGPDARGWCDLNCRTNEACEQSLSATAALFGVQSCCRGIIAEFLVQLKRQTATAREFCRSAYQ